MKHFSVAAEKSRLVVSKLLEAAKSTAEAADAQRRQQEALLAVKAQREREREHHQHQHQQLQQQMYMNGGHSHHNSMDHHSTDSPHSHSPIDQLAPTNLPHPGMGLPMSLSLGLGINGATALPINVSTGWQDPISAGGMGSTTPQGMPPGGAFWDDMMWDSFTPIPGSNQNHHGFQMEAFVDNNYTSEVSSHHGWSGYGHGQPM
jgi:hypothetical protein